jgi:cytochrome c5
VAAATPAVVDKGGTVAVAATKPGLSRVGSDTCEMCHEVQFASWSKTAHAARNPPLDCESCHGPGSEYKAMAVMKDPAKARAAGLVIPDKAFCSNCHTKGVTDAFLKKAHAHEE